MSDEKLIEEVEDFISSQKDLDPDFDKIFKDNFWEILA